MGFERSSIRTSSSSSSSSSSPSSSLSSSSSSSTNCRSKFFSLFFFLLFFFFFFFFHCCITTNIAPSPYIRNSYSGKPVDFYAQGEGREEKRRRRRMRGLGSSPPRCMGKCERCTPCKPVHVPVPPGTPVTAEYYPEAWRCKCGNRLYMP